MAVLHLINRSPAESRALEHCLARAGEGDGVLLIEDGVYAAAQGSAFEVLIHAAAGRIHFHALLPDLEARGLESSEVADGVRPVDDRGFVALAVEYSLVQSWF